MAGNIKIYLAERRWEGADRTHVTGQPKAGGPQQQQQQHGDGRSALETDWEFVE
jgi:hypothetical protein